MSRKDNGLSTSKRRKLSHTTETPRNGRNTASDDGNSSLDDEGSEPRQPSRALPPAMSPAKMTQRPAVSGVAEGSILGARIRTLLAEIAPRSHDESRYHEHLKAATQISDAIKKLPDFGPLSIAEAEKHCQEQHGIGIPLPSPPPPKDSNLRFEYRSPEFMSIQPPGYHLARGGDTLLLAVQMPSALLQDKDYLNLRCFHKRAFYLARIAAGLKEVLADQYQPQYQYQDGIELLPELVLTRTSVTATSQKTSRLIVLVTLPTGTFVSDKTLPTKNCVRSTQPSKTEPTPTPFYNACVRRLASHDAIKTLVDDATARVPAFAEACRIGQHWLHQRRFDSAIQGGGFGRREWIEMCALLFQAGGHRDQALFSERYSVVQLFKAMLQVLATRDLTRPWIVRGHFVEHPVSEGPVFYDCKTGVNILHKMTSFSYASLRSHARSSLQILNSKLDDSFEKTFAVHVALPSLQFDELYRAEIVLKTQNSANHQEQLEKLHSILAKGLGDRVDTTDLKVQSQTAWPLRTGRPTNRIQSVQIGLRTNPEHSGRLVDHGPSAEEQEAATDFQRFWGSKSELRRFKDGSITESLVWEEGTPVTFQIIEHLMQRHFSMKPGDVSSLLDDLQGKLPRSQLSSKYAFALINQKFQSLSSTLHSLSDLPLPVRSISPTGAALRSATRALPLGSYGSSVEVLIQFDSSGRWPDSLPAIQNTKIAFLVKLGDVLSTADSSLTTRIGLENTSSDTTGYFNTSFLDVIFPAPAPGLGPITFRLRIHHERELHLLQSALSDISLHGAVRDTLAKALATHKRDFIASPAHTAALRTLLTRFPALSSTIRLLKTWASAHLLTNHLPGEALELIACSVFLNSSPWAVPASATTALLRSLHLLSQWDWVSLPLIVDLSQGQEMTAAERAEAKTRFDAWRKLDPKMNQVSWFIGTNIDETGVAWTGSGRVEKVIAGRVTALAEACVELLTTGDAGLSTDISRSLFESPLDDYDFLLHLDKSVTNKGQAQSNSREKFRNLEVESETDTGRIGFDPVQDFLGDLQSAFGTTALFMHGDSPDRSNVIAGLWRPSVQGQREWRVRLGWSSVPLSRKAADEEEATVQGEINKKAVLKEIEVLGAGIVREAKMLR